MTKFLRLFVITMIASILLSCSNLAASKQGKVSVLLPGGKTGNRAVTTVKYTKDDVSYYKITLTSEELSFRAEKEGKGGETVEFDSLEPGNYTLNASAYKELDSKDIRIAEIAVPVEITVIAGVTAEPTLKLIPLSYEIDDGNDSEPENPAEPVEPDEPTDPDEPVEPADPTEPENPTEPDDETIVILGATVSLKKGVEYINYNDLLLMIAQDPECKIFDAFEITFTFTKGESGDQIISDPINLAELADLSISMPVARNNADGNKQMPFVGPVPFSFMIKDANYKISDLEVMVRYESVLPSESNIEFKNMATSAAIEDNTVKIPAVTGSLSISTNLNVTPNVYYLYQKDANNSYIKVQDTYESGVIPIKTDDVNFSVENDGNSDYLNITADGALGNKNGTYTFGKSVTLVQSDYAIPEDTELCTATKTLDLEVVPYKISDEIVDREGKAVKGKLYINTYTFKVENEADSGLDEKGYMWYLPDTTQNFYLSPALSQTKVVIKELPEKELITTLSCSILDDNDKVIVELDPITFTVAALGSEEVSYSAELIQTEKNNSYVIEDDDGNLCVLYGNPLNKSDFEFKKIVNGEEEPVTDTSNLVIDGSLTSSVLGEIPVKIKNNLSGSSEIYETTVTYKVYTQVPYIDIIASQETPGNYNIKLQANLSGYSVYGEEKQIYPENIYCNIRVLKDEKDVWAIAEVPAISGDSFELFELDEDKILPELLNQTGTYTIEVTAWETNNDYAALFLLNDKSFTTVKASFTIE